MWGQSGCAMDTFRFVISGLKRLLWHTCGNSLRTVWTQMCLPEEPPEYLIRLLPLDSLFMLFQFPQREVTVASEVFWLLAFKHIHLSDCAVVCLQLSESRFHSKPFSSHLLSGISPPSMVLTFLPCAVQQWTSISASRLWYEKHQTHTHQAFYTRLNVWAQYFTVFKLQVWLTPCGCFRSKTQVLSWNDVNLGLLLFSSAGHVWYPYSDGQVS